MTELDPYGPAAAYIKRRGFTPTWATYENRHTSRHFEYETPQLTPTQIQDLARSDPWRATLTAPTGGIIRITFRKTAQPSGAA